MLFCNQIYLSIYLCNVDGAVQWKEKYPDMLSGCSGNTEAQNSTVKTLSVSRACLTAIHQSD